jgi:Protein of unknown function (DUF1571)
MNWYSVNRIKKYRFFLILLFIFLFINSGNLNTDPVNLLSLLETQSGGIKNLKVTIQIKERINGEYLTHKANFKISYSPYKLYLLEDYPRKGLEVLYVEGLNNGRAWVKPNTFPWTTIAVNPLSNAMRNGQHHSLFKSGFAFFIDVLDHLQKKYQNNLSNLLIYNGRVKYNNIVCNKITFTNPNFKYIYYTVVECDNLENLSYKLKVNDYMIKELNPDISSFDKLEPGKKILVPTDYGATFILYIDEQTNLLIGVKVFDEKGLWEEYSYSNIAINPTFTQTDFDIDNPEYNF